MSARRAILAVFLFLISTSAHYQKSFLKSETSLEQVADDEREKYRLPGDVIPSYYKVKIYPEGIDNGFFRGEVGITLKVTTSGLTNIVLNAEQMVLQSSSLVEVTEGEPPNLLVDEGCTQNEEALKYSLLECRTKEPLSSESVYLLTIAYRGTLGKDNRGLYMSRYSEKGEPKTLLSTQFGYQARRFIPSFDEPRFKAQYQFDLYRDPSRFSMSVSNANIDKTETEGEWTVDRYRPTTEIATYVIAVVIADYDQNIDTEERGKHKFGVFARPEAINQTAFAMEFGPKLLEEFRKWTGLSYYDFRLVEKMDMAAPTELAAGAMENWGLMIHREANLLYNAEYVNAAQKQQIAAIISHEVSHMWFGNLVTCDWWDVLWLNEGFARYFQFVGVDLVDASYKTLEQFPTIVAQVAMADDATDATYPLTNRGEVFSLSEIRQMFGGLTYDKGGSILRMVHNVLGEEKFQAAIRQYLVKQSYKTAQPEDLFAEIEAQAPGGNIGELFERYTTKPGIPVVFANRQDNRVSVNQSRFKTDGLSTEADETWTIPLTVAFKEEDFKNTLSNYQLMRFSTPTASFDVPEDAQFFVLNVQQFGYYRVNYDAASWRDIGDALKSDSFGGIHPVNRAQIIDDLFAFARAGLVDYSVALDIVSYVEHDDHYLPWLAALRGYSFLYSRTSLESKGEFEEYLGYFLAQVFEKVGFKHNLDHLNQLLQIEVLKADCKFNRDGPCNAAVTFEFGKLEEEGRIINPNFAPAIYCSAVRSSPDNFDLLWKRYLESNYATDQKTILTALGCTANRDTLNKLLEAILTPNIRIHDKSDAFSAAYRGNLENVDLVLDYIIANPAKWGDEMSLVSTLSALSEAFTTEAQFTKANNFVESTTQLSATEKETLKTTLTQNVKNLVWDQTQMPKVQSHMKDYIDRVTRKPADPEPEDEDGLPWWAWLLISLGIIAGVALLGGGGWFVYKKYYS